MTVVCRDCKARLKPAQKWPTLKNDVLECGECGCLWRHKTEIIIRRAWPVPFKIAGQFFNHSEEVFLGEERK